MKQELTWGAATAVAIVAAIGISSQSGSRTPATMSNGRPAEHAPIQSKAARNGIQTPCADALDLLEHFFLKSVPAPDVCGYPSPGTGTVKPDADFQPRFLIATLPDPLHTHFSLLFDRFIEAIQQGAQDEGYEYDSSWMPWETEEPTLVRLPDQDEADDRKVKREEQPGILAFRDTKQAPYHHGLIVFVVGEESTRGIHRKQFENAVAWIRALEAKRVKKTGSVAILGPTFSGSFPSLEELLSSDDVRSVLHADSSARFPIYSGSTSGGDAGRIFAKTALTQGTDFRSFVQDDETTMDRFCRYLGQAYPSNLAVVSEDETAYGNLATSNCPGATWIYYPRDISRLRAAYQSQSMFSGSSGQNQDTSQRKSLPTDLADPAGHEHDTVRSYAGNQTPLAQEAELLGIVDVLRANRAQYVVVRSSNTLDPLFLANFLRRDYSEARVVVLNSDLLFQRGQDAMALAGVMTLSTYPLFPWGRDWTAQPPYDSHSHRVFPENSTEGTYIASRLLLQSFSGEAKRDQSFGCQLVDNQVFTPSLKCQATGKGPYVAFPDYAPPYWTDAPCAANPPCESCKPATWLSVITRSGTWPLAALNDHTLPRLEESAPCLRGAAPSPPARPPEHSRWPSLPRSMKLFLISLFGLALFHAYCCAFASFTAKPAFRAYFATSHLQHQVLVPIASCLMALMALLTGWGCGLFSGVVGPPPTGTPIVWTVIVLVCLIACIAMVTNIIVTEKLKGESGSLIVRCKWRIILSVAAFCVFLWLFFLTWVHPLEGALILANRAFAYWRSINLTSGVSPIVPFLSLTIGLYLWFWYSLHGLALFGPDRPRLPRSSKLTIKVPVPTKTGVTNTQMELRMFSQENADPLERVALPLAGRKVLLGLLIFVLLAGLAVATSAGPKQGWSAAHMVDWVMSAVPVRSLGARRYGLIFCFWLGLYFSIILTEAWQVWRMWSGVRQLLVFLDRLALRRTLGALRGFSWGSIWKMSGNVLDVRYKLLSRQVECLNHLHALLSESTSSAGDDDCLTAIDESRKAGMAFGEWYSKKYDDPKASDLGLFTKFQEKIAETTGVVFAEFLVPRWRLEKQSLIQADPGDKEEDGRTTLPPRSPDETIRTAEELVCLTYLGFAQNILGRIRTAVLAGVCMFVAATVAVSNYPFDPRALLSGVLLFLFVAFGGAVIFVYADMHRDATLSHITNTKPGELGSEFWLKLVGYGAAPALGLLTTVFPEWSGFLFSWLQPGLSSLK
jgi:hypothetical protein